MPNAIRKLTLAAIRLTLCLFYLGAAPVLVGNDAQNDPISIEMPAAKDPVAASLTSENATVQPGTPLWVAVRMQIDKNWHAYWKNPGDAGMPPAITWELPEGFTVGTTLWPTPERFALDTAVGFGYTDELILLVEITPPATFKDTTASLKGAIRWVVCNDSTCLPGESPISLTLTVSDKTPVKAETNATLFSQARAKIPQAHPSMTVERDDGLLTLAFKDKRTIEKAEFFPEIAQSINTSVPPLMEQSADAPENKTLIIKELSSQQSLKGVLVLHTSTGKEAYAIDLPVADPSTNTSVASAPLPSSDDMLDAALSPLPETESYAFEGGVALAIGMAFLGGMLLNMMPCVLPVISFKVLSFIQLAGQQRKLIFKHGLFFSAGVLTSFWVLAALLLVLQAYGRSVGWGFQLQEPLFVAILAAFIFLFGLSLFGLFEFGTSIMAKAGEAQQRSGKNKDLFGSFLSGVLATAVATPCTGPFLGSAVGFAVTLPSYQAMLIFTSLGLGMSFPYLLLAAFPSMLRILPKPGPWMITFKELMGFLMIASVIWLVWVFGAQTGTFAVSLFLAGLFFLSIAAWIFGRWASPLCNKMTRRIGMLTAVAFFAFGSYTIVASTSTWAQAMGGTTTPSELISSEIAEVWEEFSPERVAALREKGIPVFIDFTAKWCLICQANHLVLSGDKVAQKFAERGVVRMKADWTKNDEVIAAELRKFGRNSVPLYILYDGDKKSKPQILPQVLTPEVVLGALENL